MVITFLKIALRHLLQIFIILELLLLKFQQINFFFKLLDWLIKNIEFN